MSAAPKRSRSATRISASAVGRRLRARRTSPKTRRRARATTSRGQSPMQSPMRIQSSARGRKSTQTTWTHAWPSQRARQGPACTSTRAACPQSSSTSAASTSRKRARRTTRSSRRSVTPSAPFPTQSCPSSSALRTTRGYLRSTLNRSPPRSRPSPPRRCSTSRATRQRRWLRVTRLRTSLEFASRRATSGASGGRSPPRPPATKNLPPRRTSSSNLSPSAVRTAPSPSSRRSRRSFTANGRRSPSLRP
mmetsp:Transcript_28191/g.97079  ORF Transcript_28191/g.97079 Transcript_28191/m.97079 type:complete len:249 (+) Transcript_28191:724-1470(+)